MTWLAGDSRRSARTPAPERGMTNLWDRPTYAEVRMAAALAICGYLARIHRWEPTVLGC